VFFSRIIVLVLYRYVGLYKPFTVADDNCAYHVNHQLAETANDRQVNKVSVPQQMSLLTTTPPVKHPVRTDDPGLVLWQLQGHLRTDSLGSTGSTGGGTSCQDERRRSGAVKTRLTSRENKTRSRRKAQRKTTRVHTQRFSFKLCFAYCASDEKSAIIMSPFHREKNISFK
jgi:hypothetical protein